MSQPRWVSLNVSPKRIAVILASIIAALAAAHVVTTVLFYTSEHSFQWGLHRQFRLNQEANLPTWYSSSTLFMASLILGLIGITKYHAQDHYGKHWLGLAAIFLWLSADEGSRFHEMTEEFYSQAHYTGAFYYPWVIGGIVMVLVIGLSYLKFVLHLPSPTRNLVTLSGIIYVGGALGLEAVEAWFDERHGYQNLTYDLMAGVEEVCEMTGVALFIYALMRYAGSLGHVAGLSFDDPPQRHAELKEVLPDKGSADAPTRAA